MDEMRSVDVPPSLAYWTDSDSGVNAMGTSMRVRTLAETATLASALLEDTGITRVADVTGLDIVGIPVYHSVRPRAMPGLNTVTSGKGVTNETARLSAVMEAIERRWCEPDVDGLVVGSLRELEAGGRATLDPRRLVPRRNHVWTEDTPITWCAARELTTDSVLYVPALAVFTPFEQEAGLFSSNTMGLAIGNAPAESLLHALFEVVEHDATAFGETLGWGKRITLDTLPAVARLLTEKFLLAGLDVDVLAYQNEIGIPAFYAAVQDYGRYDGMLFNGGAGCHLDSEIAVVRALTEAAQSRLNVIGGAREDFSRQAYRRDVDFESLRNSYLNWRDVFQETSWHAFESPGIRSIEENLSNVIEALGRAKVDTICAVELAPKGYPFSVTKVIVPGLEVHHQDKGRIGVRLNHAMTLVADPRGVDIRAF